MDRREIARLRTLTTFHALVDYLRDELDWPIEVEDADDITFEYDPAELGIDPKHAVKIESIKQVRPLVDNQPWGVFYIEFEAKRLPVVVLRRILRALVPKSRGRDPDRPVWRMPDLLFISAQGEAGYRSISFAHFRQREGRADELRTFSWDSRETHFFYLKNLNLEALRWPRDEADTGAWREEWRQAFTAEHRYVIRTSQSLAREMARQARTVRELVEEVYDLEAQDGPLHRLYGGFKEALLHDLTPEAFADMVAQTVAYGLFSAAAQTHDLSYERMVELIPNTNPFLRDLLGELTADDAMDVEELGVGQLVDLLNQTDIESILQDFGRQSGGGREDPVVHFYEDFLREYDRKQRVRRGVFYTPDPVVSYIVRSVDFLLRTEFGLEGGLADTSVDPETGEPLVQILDPACGTGTFLAHAIDQIEATVKARGPFHFGCADWSEYVAEHLLPRLNGFELMMAPYAVAHMKLGLKLRQTGYDFTGDERLRVYLTNTLEEPVEMHERLALAGFLSKESNAAARVKRKAPITIVIGNPPYAGHSANESEWIAGLLRGVDGQGRRVESYFEVDGHDLGERNPKWLNDDYVKFIRFGQWRVEQTGAGILAFITNHSYLDNPTFRGMRQSLMASFDVIYLLDLHGNTKKREVSPDGGLDENVFDIQQGVAILVALKRSPRASQGMKESDIYHLDLWGLRGRKYHWLLNMDVQSIKWGHLEPQSPYYLFMPQDTARRAEYNRGWIYTEIAQVNVLGIQTHRDRVAIAFDVPMLSAQIRSYLGRLPDKSSWQHYCRKVDYRPFDTRVAYLAKEVADRPRLSVIDHLLHDNIVLNLVRQTKAENWRHVLASPNPTPAVFIEVKDGSSIFPLYLYPDPSRATLFDHQVPTEASGGRRPNLAPEFIAAFSELTGLRFIPDGLGDLQINFGPEDILHYSYAVLHSPTYRTRYADFLKIDFPRLPLTSDRMLFAQLASLGADLVALHLLEDAYPAASWSQAGGEPPFQQPITTFVGRAAGTTIGAFRKSACYQDGRVYLDTSQRSRSSYFEGVPEDVWNFHIGGYQVLHKWLYDRRGTKGQPGRTLTEEDIAHYQRIVVALKETMRLMGEIDEVIEEHGGWPIE